MLVTINDIGLKMFKYDQEFVETNWDVAQEFFLKFFVRIVILKPIVSFLSFGSLILLLGGDTLFENFILVILLDTVFSLIPIYISFKLLQRTHSKGVFISYQMVNSQVSSGSRKLLNISFSFFWRVYVIGYAISLVIILASMILSFNLPDFIHLLVGFTSLYLAWLWLVLFNSSNGAYIEFRKK